MVVHTPTLRKSSSSALRAIWPKHVKHILTICLLPFVLDMASLDCLFNKIQERDREKNRCNQNWGIWMLTLHNFFRSFPCTLRCVTCVWNHRVRNIGNSQKHRYHAAVRSPPEKALPQDLRHLQKSSFKANFCIYCFEHPSFFFCRPSVFISKKR